MNILGLSGALGHDPSAALLLDGELVAAAEEERFIRDKHAKNQMPIQAARYCLEAAGLSAKDIDIVAFPYAPISLARPARWRFAQRHWYAPDRALDALCNGNRRFRRNRRRVREAGAQLGVDWSRTEFVPVEHHLAHAASAYHCSGFREKTAILGVDGKGEYTTTFLGYGEQGRIHSIKQFHDPDSLGGLYGAMTEYLGFEMLDGEYKVMGMAPYGDPNRHDLSRLIRPCGRGFRVDTRYVNTLGLRRYKEDGVGFHFSPKLVDWLGPKRRDEAADEPYIHYAAALQRLFEDWCLKLLDAYLGDILQETGKLAFAGGGALNVKLNQRILALDPVDALFVQPAAGDSGTSLGAAAYVAAQRGERIGKMTHVFLGPSYSNADCLAALQAHQAVERQGIAAESAVAAPAAGRLAYRRLSAPVQEAADIIAAGHPLAWFQGRMEFGPRALGARSILGCPSTPGMADRINEQIKFRERWRPFCPSLLDRVAPNVIGSRHPAPFMTITFDVAPDWKARIPEVVHEDGTARVQVVRREANPKYYTLLEALERRTGNGVVLNTSLNRRGEPIVCSPADALDMFLGCGLKYLMLEDWLVTKQSG